MAQRPALKCKAKRKDKTGNPVDIFACWRSDRGSGFNLKLADGAFITLADGTVIDGANFWLNVYENEDAKPVDPSEAHALVSKVAQTFSLPTVPPKTQKMPF